MIPGGDKASNQSHKRTLTVKGIGFISLAFQISLEKYFFNDSGNSITNTDNGTPIWGAARPTAPYLPFTDFSKRTICCLLRVRKIREEILKPQINRVNSHHEILAVTSINERERKK
jgi:hypothetical protein